jgi:WD40 repeat protein
MYMLRIRIQDSQINADSGSTTLVHIINYTGNPGILKILESHRLIPHLSYASRHLATTLHTLLSFKKIKLFKLNFFLEINCCDVSPGDELVATGSLDKTAKLWTRDLRLVAVLKGHKRGVWCCQFSMADR